MFKFQCFGGGVSTTYFASVHSLRIPTLLSASSAKIPEEVLVHIFGEATRATIVCCLVGNCECIYLLSLYIYAKLTGSMYLKLTSHSDMFKVCITDLMLFVLEWFYNLAGTLTA